MYAVIFYIFDPHLLINGFEISAEYLFLFFHIIAMYWFTKVLLKSCPNENVKYIMGNTTPEAYEIFDEYLTIVQPS